MKTTLVIVGVFVAEESGGFNYGGFFENPSN